jgi:hypothetical protein
MKITHGTVNSLGCNCYHPSGNEEKKKKCTQDTTTALALYFSMTAPKAVFGKQFIRATILRYIHHEHSTKYTSLADI